MTVRSFSLALTLGLWTVAGSAQAGLVPTPPTTIASAIGLAACLEAAEIDGKVTWLERAACYAIAFDPPAEEVSGIDLTLSFDPKKVQFGDEVFYFGDLSASGGYLPLIPPTYGAFVPLTPIPGAGEFDPAGTDLPRPGTVATLTVDNILGTLVLSLDFGANPIPAGAPAQNLFALNMLTKGRTVSGIRYYDTPGSYDVMQTSFVCRASDREIGCGSDTPVYGWDIATVPLPAPAFLLMGGLAALGLGRATRRR